MEGARYIGTFAIAAIVTFGLFWIMQALIGVDFDLDESEATRVIDFVRLKRDTDTQTKDRELPDRKPPEKEPPPPELNLSDQIRPDSGETGIAAGDFDIAADLGKAGLGGLASADTDAVPLVRVQPEYPQRAAQRGIQGWVEVEFTISRAGTVQNPRVIGYEPSTIFNKAALRAIKKWKYNPKIEEGKAVEQPGIAVRLRFAL